MPKKYDVVAITGEYEKGGVTKPRYQNVGMVIEKDGKHYLKINTPIVLHDDGHVINFFSLFEPKQRPSSGNQTATEGGEAPEGDVPF